VKTVNDTVPIGVGKMLLMFCILIIPILTLARLRLGFTREILWSVLRMTVQLSLVGLYLKYIFALNSIAVTSLWIITMLVVTNIVVIRRSGLSRKIFFWPTMLSVFFSTLITVAFFVGFVISPDPVYDARYLIPITGMLLGNTLRANVITLERFYSSVKDTREQHLTYLMLGASLEEAVMPHFRAAVKAAVSPTIASMATIGVVSLPGMMTGQILGGAFPVEAIKYQIAIMVCIFTAMTLASYFNIKLTLKRAFDPYCMLRDDIFE